MASAPRVGDGAVDPAGGGVSIWPLPSWAMSAPEMNAFSPGAGHDHDPHVGVGRER